MQGALVDLDLSRDAGRGIRLPECVLRFRVALVVVRRNTVEHVGGGVRNQQMRTVVTIGREPSAMERRPRP